MADLTNLEKIKLEKLFDMGGGCVLDFSNRTISEFVATSVNRDIYDDKYEYLSGSKANRIRAFWEKESPYVVGKLILDLLDYWRTIKLLSYTEITEQENALYEECIKIVNRLQGEKGIQNIDILKKNDSDDDFKKLSRSIIDSIEKDEPEMAIDRLHTFSVKYFRDLCDKHGIAHDRKMPLHSIAGVYIKYLRDDDLVESKMAINILKSSISVLDAFNDVRNNKSFAHDNKILDYNESILIFNSINNIINFIESIESIKKPNSEDSSEEEEIRIEDIQF